MPANFRGIGCGVGFAALVLLLAAGGIAGYVLYADDFFSHSFYLQVGPVKIEFPPLVN